MCCGPSVNEHHDRSHLEMSLPSQNHAPRHNYQTMPNLHSYFDVVQGILCATAEAGMTPQQQAKSINMYANVPQSILYTQQSLQAGVMQRGLEYRRCQHNAQIQALSCYKAPWLVSQRLVPPGRTKNAHDEEECMARIQGARCKRMYKHSVKIVKYWRQGAHRSMLRQKHRR